MQPPAANHTVFRDKDQTRKDFTARTQNSQSFEISGVRGAGPSQMGHGWTRMDTDRHGIFLKVVFVSRKECQLRSDAIGCRQVVVLDP